MKFTRNLDDDLCKEKVATSNSDGRKYTMKLYTKEVSPATEWIIATIWALFLSAIFLTFLAWACNFV